MTDPSEKSLCDGVKIERKDYMVLLEEGCCDSNSSGQDRIE